MSGHCSASSPRDRGKNENTVIQVLIIGKSGNGKSSAGNAVLGEKAFDVTTGINTCTQHTQLAESTRTHQSSSFKLQVVDLPDVCDDMDEEQQAKEIQLCKTLTFPGPTVICLVIRADVRFTPAEYTTYRTTMELLETGTNEGGRTDGSSQGRSQNEGGQAPSNLVVLFTMGDNLPDAQQESFDEDVKKANKELQQVMKDAKDRYVLLSKEDIPQDPGRRPSNAATTSALSPFFDIVLRMHQTRVSAAKPLHAMLFGIGSGKSATGNTLLYPQTWFREKMGFSYATDFCQTAVGRLAGYKLEVTDTPALDINDDEETVSHQIHGWFDKLNHTPDVLLFVIKAWDRFQENEYHLLQILRDMMGKDVNSRVIVVFTGADILVRYGKTMENLLSQAPASLTNMLTDVGNRYVLIDNHASSLTDKLIQRNTLLKAMVHLRDTVKTNPLKLAPRETPSRQLQRGVLDVKHGKARVSWRKKKKNRQHTESPNSHPIDYQNRQHAESPSRQSAERPSSSNPLRHYCTLC